MKALAAALTMIVLTAQVGQAAPAAPVHLPQWAASLSNRVPFFSYRGSRTSAAPAPEETPAADASRATSPEGLSPEAKHLAILMERAEQELRYRTGNVANTLVASSMQIASQRD